MANRTDTNNNRINGNERLNELKNAIQETCDKKISQYNNLINVRVSTNTYNIEKKNSGTVTIEAYVPDADFPVDENTVIKDYVFSGTLIVSIRKNGISITFINNETHGVVTNSFGENADFDAVDFITNYATQRIERFLFPDNYINEKKNNGKYRR